MIKEERMVKNTKQNKVSRRDPLDETAGGLVPCSRWWRLNGAPWKESSEELSGAFLWHRCGDICLPDRDSQNELSFHPKCSAWQGARRSDSRCTLLSVGRHWLPGLLCVCFRPMCLIMTSRKILEHFINKRFLSKYVIVKSKPIYIVVFCGVKFTFLVELLYFSGHF